MNYSKAVRDSHKNPVPTLQSAAETELKRQLNAFELQTLAEKFSLDIVVSNIEKVRIVQFW